MRMINGLWVERALGDVSTWSRLDCCSESVQSLVAAAWQLGDATFHFKREQLRQQGFRGYQQGQGIGSANIGQIVRRAKRKTGEEAFARTCAVVIVRLRRVIYR